MDFLKMLGLGQSNAEQDDVLNKMAHEVENAYEANPPTIAIIGLSGVGKSSTINAMFGTTLKTSATTRGTSEFESIRARLSIQRGKGTGGVGFLKVYDAPGLGEDRRLDPGYLKMYEEHLPKCDVALWIVAARNRALALDQQYIEKLGPLLTDKVVFGISQVDLVDPNNWDRGQNLPSSEQKSHIEAIVQDRSKRLSDAFGKKIECLAFSATNYYRLMELYEHIISGATKDRRWMFEFVRSFSSADWLNRAEGLTQQQKDAILKKHTT